ncbi:hypothetical protein MMC24_000475 [Lignoscripta atroalba]|nr:hypothetical protein [Lignoscripta atroalba]
MHGLGHCARRRCHAQRGACRLLKPHSAVLQTNVRFGTCAPSLKEGNGQNSTKVRWYEQLFDGASHRKRIDAEEIEDDEARDLRARISQLERELKELREGPSSTIGPLLDQLSDEDRKKVEAALKENASDGSGQPSNTTPEAPGSETGEQKLYEDIASHSLTAQYVPSQGEVEIKLELPRQQDVYLQRLNAALAQAATNISNAAARKNLWRWYTRCKQTIPRVLSFVTDGAWTVLWESQYSVPPSNPDRAKHLRILLEDMLKGGRQLSPSQRLVYVKSLYAEGRHSDAFQKWQSEFEDLHSTQETSRGVEDLGVRLYVTQGDLHAAQNLALGFLTDTDRARARILIPVMEAWAQNGDEIATKHAWALYLRLRTLLGPEIRLEDYDEITMAFLNSGRTDIALAVFKDLMLTGQESRYDSRELYKTSLGLVGSLQSQSIDMTELTQVSMTALTVLPRRFQNKFFYGSWMKKLLGMGEVNAAAAIVELMYERGVKPDPKHLNGIIGAWLRGGSAKSMEKALQMGWAMVQQRLDFVARRRGKGTRDGATGVSDLHGSNVDIPSHLQRTITPATIETFSLLLLHYERRGMLNYVEHLKECLLAAEITPNAYFMNHLLYAELRRGSHLESWKIYQKMTRTVKPDLETFACLWDCEKAHLDKLLYHSDGFPGPRRVFCDMSLWLSRAGAKARESARQDFSRELYHQIIRCLCLARDLEGTMIALHALKESFSLYPDQDTARMITLQVAHMGSDELKPNKRRRSRLSSNPQSKVNFAKVKQVLELLTEQRTENLQRHQIKAEDLDETQQMEEQLFLLVEFLRAVLRKTAPEADTVEKDVDAAAWEMGVGGLKMADHLLSA